MGGFFLVAAASVTPTMIRCRSKYLLFFYIFISLFAGSTLGGFLGFILCFSLLGGL
jgi:predicted PurR-regulated permease PerM